MITETDRIKATDFPDFCSFAPTINLQVILQLILDFFDM